MKIKKEWIYVSIIAIVVLINYINIFQNQFAWDDYNFIVGNKKITSFSYVPYYFTHESMNSLWRPLRETFYIITYAIWGLNPFGYHLNAILQHLIISIIVFFIAEKMVKNKEIALFTALLFAAHPIHTERVTGMTASFDMLGLLLYLLAFYFFIEYREINQKKYLAYSILAYILALLSNEEAITFLGIVFLYDFVFIFDLKVNFQKIKKILAEYATIIAITFLYVILHILIVKRVGRELGYFDNSFFVTFLTSIKAIVEYILLLFLPYDPVVYRTIPKATSFLSVNFLISLLILGLIFYFGYISFKKSKKIIFFSIALFFITMFLFYNFIPKSTLIADRYLYLPSLGFCMLAGYFIFNIGKSRFFGNKQTISIVILVLVLSTYTYITIERNKEWMNEEILLKKTISLLPESTSAYWALGNLYRRQGNYEEAITNMQKAIDTSSSNYEALESMGVIYAEIGQYDRAVGYFEAAIAIYPEYKGVYYKAHNDLGLAYYNLNQYNNSIAELKIAIGAYPEYSKAHNDIAMSYAQIGEYGLAEKEFKIAIELNPDDEGYKKNLEKLYGYMNKK